MLAVASVVVVFVHPQDDPLKAIYAVLLGIPWSLLVAELATDSIIWNGMLFFVLPQLINTLILYGLCSGLRRLWSRILRR